jgi:hypothetical protein
MRSGVMYSPRTNYVRRIRREAFVFAFGSGWLVLIVGLVVAQSLTFRSPLSLPIMLLGSVASVVCTFGLLAYRVSRGRKRLEACNWQRCGSCEYDTTPIGETGTCPECGREFSSSLLKADFQSFVNQVCWWMPAWWRDRHASSRQIGDETGSEHAPLRAPKPGAKDYVDRSVRTGNAIGFLGSFVGFFAFGAVVSLLQFKLGGPLLFIFGALCLSVITNVVAQTPYMLYRRARLARRNWNICPWCEHDTRDIGSEGTCPKCGGEFSTTDLKADFDGACRTSALMFWLRPDDGSQPTRSDGSPQ